MEANLVGMGPEDAAGSQLVTNGQLLLPSLFEGDRPRSRHREGGPAQPNLLPPKLDRLVGRPIRLQVQAAHHADMISAEIRRRVKGGERGRGGRNRSGDGDLPQIVAPRWRPTPSQTRQSAATVSPIYAHRHSNDQDAQDKDTQPAQANLPAQAAEQQEPGEQQQDSHAAGNKAPHGAESFLGIPGAADQDDARGGQNEDCAWNPATRAAPGRGGGGAGDLRRCRHLSLSNNTFPQL